MGATSLRDAAHVGIRHARHRSPQTQRPTVGGHPSKGNPTLAVRGQLDDRTGSTVSRLSCVLHESTRTSSFLVQDFVRTPRPSEQSWLSRNLGAVLKREGRFETRFPHLRCYRDAETQG